MNGCEEGPSFPLESRVHRFPKLLKGVYISLLRISPILGPMYPQEPVNDLKGTPHCFLIKSLHAAFVDVLLIVAARALTDESPAQSRGIYPNPQM